MAKNSRVGKKKTPKKSKSSKVKKLAIINAKSLSKAQKRHLKDFGELHPINSSFSAGDNKNVKLVQDVEGEVNLKHCATNNKHQEEEEVFGLEKELNAYQQLIGSLGNKVSSQRFLMEEDKEMDGSMATSDDDSGDNDHMDMENVYDDTTKVHDTEQIIDIINEINDQDHHKDNSELHVTNEIDGGEDDYRQPIPSIDSDGEESDTNLDVQEDGQDPFTVHFEQDLDESVVMQLTEKSSFKQSTLSVQSLGTVTVSEPTCNVPVVKTINSKCSPLFKVKEKLCKSWINLNQTNETFSPIQSSLFGYVNRYQDVFYADRNFDNGEEIRKLYCLHTVNHVLKTGSRVLKNNAKIRLAQKENKELEDNRDQGLTRPKVLIVVPFRDSALKVVNVIIDLLTTDAKGQVMNKKRFLEDYSDSTDVQESKRSFRPDDFEKMFAGNIDDSFRIGLSLKKNSIKLYSQFYSSDVIIASPLGLRTVIGTEGESFGDFDFLSSIEVLIVDQMDVFLMQNWEHVKHAFDHLHKQPKSSHEVDFSRVRNWSLNGWFPFKSFAGKIKIQASEIPGSICQAVTQVPQVFHQVQCLSFNEDPDKRFEYFINKILAEYRGQGSSNTAIFIPSYFDFVRLRNYFRREDISFTHISEYSKRSDITRARNWFKDGHKQFLLYTERFYFYYRYRINGIRNIIFYGLPHYAQFYPEILNFLDMSRESAVTCTVLYTKYDNHRLSNVVGSQRCSHMISSKKHVHLFVTGEQASVV